VRENSAPLTGARLEELKKQAAGSRAPVYNPQDPDDPTLKPSRLTADDGK
jgi:hypothetical protein